MSFSAILSSIVALGAFLKYPMIAVVAPFGGPLFIMACGFFLHEGLVGFPEILIAVAVGDLAMDSFWYLVGYRYAHNFIKRYGQRFGFTEKRFEDAKRFFSRHGIFILFLAKLSAGLGLIQLVLISAGVSRIRFWKYFLVTTAGELAWVSFILYLGYRYADLYGTLRNDFKALALAGTLLILLPITIIVSRYVRTRALKDL
jgi:membrane protein DedA with SNARE-associated domain